MSDRISGAFNNFGLQNDSGEGHGHKGVTRVIDRIHWRKVFSADQIDFDEERRLFVPRRHHQGHGVLLLSVFLGVMRYGFISGPEDLNCKLYVALDTFAFATHVGQCSSIAVHFVSFAVAVNILEVNFKETNDGVRPQCIVIEDCYRNLSTFELFQRLFLEVEEQFFIEHWTQCFFLDFGRLFGFHHFDFTDRIG